MGDGKNGLWIGLLGPLEVRLGGEPIPIQAGKQRSLLAVLFTARGRVVSTDRVIDQLWGADAPGSHQNALWVHVSNLRRALGDAETPVLVTRSPGYRLDPAGYTSDVDDFERLVGEGRALAEGDPAAAAVVLGEALEMWRGRPYEDFTYEDWADGEITRLTELRLDAVELRIHCDLRRGLAAELVPELEGLVGEHPLREGLTASLMLALYRSGRQADALRTCTRLRERLVSELGVDPSSEIQQLEERMLAADPSLTWADPTRAVVRGPSVRGYELREPLVEGPGGTVYRAYQPSVGREVSLKVIPPALADDPSFIRRFERDAQALAGIEHPYVVPVYDYWREPGAAFLATRALQGGSLAARIDRGALDPGDVARIVDQVGSAIEAVHHGGLLVRRFTADSVSFDEEGNAFLADLEPTESDVAGTGTTKADLHAFATVVAEALVGRSGSIPELLVGLPPALAVAVGDTSDGDIGRYRADVLAALEAGRPTVHVDENPYKGLRSFEPSDAADFFGRERFVERLVAHLSGTGPASRFVAVVGPSGGGKSSVVKAGLIPALRAGAAPGSEDWYVARMVPGAHPFDELESALMAVAVDPPASLLESLTAERGIGRTVRRILPDDAPLLLVIDQLEELFTLAATGPAERFLDAIAEVVADDTARVRVVVTLRADFYDRPLGHRSVGELLRFGTEVLTPMTPAELERAIVGPAERVGAVCEPALVGEMVAAVVDRPAALPLLQFALTEVFDRREGPTLRVSAYRDIGGVSGAVVDRAEAIFASLDGPERAAARDVFLRLVTLGEGTGDTRRRALRSELTSIAGFGSAADRVITAFSRSRLLSLDRDPVTRTPTVEIAHEALLTTWVRLAGWIEDARSDIRARHRLGEATAEWVARDRSDDFVLGGGRLARYEGWLEHPPLGLTLDERRFLEAGFAAKERQEREAEEAGRREALLVRRSRTVTALTVITILILALGAFALVQRNQASALATDVAMNDESRRLAGLAATETDDGVLALMLAVQSALATAERGVVIPEALDAVHHALQRARIPYPGEEPGMVAVRPGIGGVFALPPSQLIAYAQDHLDGRSFTREECGRFDLAPCPDVERAVPAGLTVAGGIDAYAAGGDRPLEGTEVLIVTGNGLDDNQAVERLFAGLEAETGIRVSVRSVRADETPKDIVADPRDEDIVAIAQPGFVPVAAAEGAVDVSRYLDPVALETAWSPYMRSLLSVGDGGAWPDPDGRLYGVWVELTAKSLIWYREDVFRAQGWSPPATWPELETLTDEIIAAGYAPWCVYLDSGPSSGWFATDLLETIILREYGPDVYDAWVTHEIPFNDPRVVEATNRLAELALTAGHQAVSGVEAAHLGFWQGARGLVGSNPDCLMTPFPSFIDSYLFPAERAQIGVATFPSIDPAFSDSVVGGGVYSVALTDRPEVREVMRYMNDPAFGMATMARGKIPANTSLDVARIDDPKARTLAAIVDDALEGDQFKFDGSDMMPEEIGAGVFWDEMMKLFEQDGADVFGVLVRIEAAWSNLDDR